MNLYQNELYMKDVRFVAGLELPWEKLKHKSIILSGATGLNGSFLIDVIMEKNITDELDCLVYALVRNEEKAKARFSKYMNIALLTAAGMATRMHQDIPKQFMHVDNKPVIIHTMEAFQNHPIIDVIIVVTLESWSEVVWAYARQFNITKLKWVVPGGDTGQASIKNGLDILKNELSINDVVMIHDGNRPLVSAEIISNNLATFTRYGNAVAAIPCAEVVFESEDGISSCKSTNREKLFRTQTPHTYKLGDLLDAHKIANEKGIVGTAATCMLMKELGITTYFSKGSEENIKITTLEDLKIFKALLHTRQEEWIKEG